MGYGAGHEIKLNCENYGHVVFTGKNLKLVDLEAESWDFTHPMDGMSNVNMDLLKVSPALIRLSPDDVEYFKQEGYKRGDAISFSWYKLPEGMVWSGYCRSSLKKSFPVDLTGTIDLDYAGTFDVVVSVKPADYKRFENFIEDVLDFCAEDDWLDDDGEEVSFDQALVRLYYRQIASYRL
jgi:hypothetical protein